MTVYKKHPLTAGRIVDGLAFVVTADDNKLHTLNETGTEIWALASSGVTHEQACQVLVEKFEVTVETAREDVAACLELFVNTNVLQAAD